MKRLEDALEPAAPPERRQVGLRRVGVRALTALGVVYGDIGTSPLYALRECFFGSHSVTPERGNVLGVLSLIVWSLIIVISIKYLGYVLRADNRGEGGILALMALVYPSGRSRQSHRWVLVSLGLFGAALLYGDGTITPAISVLSAVEGLEVKTKALSPYVLPITVLILLVLFRFQGRGTGRIGAVFGPVMMVWFTVIGVLGLLGVMRRPEVLEAVSPVHAVLFFEANGWAGFTVLGAVVLVVTGGEALYADMGHFGKRAIRLAWFGLVLPSLLLNYLGQGALLLDRPDKLESPFYLLAPGWAHYPLVVLATVATVIASQAIISGAFSLTRQAIQLGYSPRMRVVHTSAEEIGQVYLPGINWLLMAATIILVLAFRRSTHLAAAYGVAVTTTMVITTLLASVVAREIWGWSRWAAILVTSLFLVPDLAFFGANLIKIEYGGWIPLLMAAVIYLFMSTWYEGKRLAEEQLQQAQVSIESFLERSRKKPPQRVSGTSVFLSGSPQGTPMALTSQLDHNKVLHEQVVLLTVETRGVPFLPTAKRLDVQNLGGGFYRVIAYDGFMQSPSIPEILHWCERRGLSVDPSSASFFAGRRIIVPSKGGRMRLWRAKLFALISRNALPVPSFFHIPHGRVIEIGVEVEV